MGGKGWLTPQPTSTITDALTTLTLPRRLCFSCDVLGHNLPGLGLCINKSDYGVSVVCVCVCVCEHVCFCI
jgi:hypothetical protein